MTNIYNRMKKIVSVVFLALSLQTGAVFAQNDFEIAKNVDIFINVLNELNDKYADEISPGALTQTAISAMLKSLDPYTVYYPESIVEDARIFQSGDYGDIDLSLKRVGTDLVITELTEDGPSAEAGLLVGDIILNVNGKTTDNRTPDDVKMSLKGQPGTTCKVEVFRKTDRTTHTFSVKRKKMKAPCVPYSGLIGDNVGYIKLSTFMETTTSKDVFEAFQKLKNEGMKYLIIDLRDNGGGLLTEAVNIVNMFVDKNLTIVETKGKIAEMNNVYKTRNAPVDKDIPIVVLINENSASASEILSGSLQDLDRAVIVGKKSFGKGLVQKVYPMDYNTSMKITVSKYYIPSGRCVQNIEYFGSDTTKGAFHIPDSLAVAYKTKNNRTVYDKGGVEPDVLVVEEKMPGILAALDDSYAIFDFATRYRSKHQTIASADGFSVDDATFNEFLDFLEERDFKFESSVGEACDNLADLAKEEKQYDELKGAIEELKRQIGLLKNSELRKHKAEISQHLAQEIVSRYYFSTGKLVNSLYNDDNIKVAKSILLDQSRYKKLLSPQK